MLSFRAGTTRSFPWGNETTIHLEEDGRTVNTIVVTAWPSDPVLQEERGQHLIQNYLDSLNEEA